MTGHGIAFAEAVRTWTRIALLSFGGPAGQIAVMHRILVEERRWIGDARFLHALNYCMLLPGPEAQQLATYIGWLMHRTAGGIIAGALFVLPSLLILIALSWLYVAFGDVPWIAALFYGIKPAVTAIVAHAAWRIGSRALRAPALWLIALAAFVAIFVLNWPFPLIILGAAVIGLVGGRLAPQQFRLGQHGSAKAGGAPALIDDTTPPPPHAQFNPRRMFAIAAIGLLAWLLPMLALGAGFGWEGTLTQMAWFFTKAALMTFGGAYAVLPYVYQGAVEQHAWVSAAQMIDGLALGETTPGPLIMVVAFVGFVGAWSQQALGPEALFLAGALAACVVTWFTFLPSFLFILVGGPLVEATRHELRFTAPLTAITAAVVGVIVNLALFFAWHVFWPQGFAGSFDGVAMLICALALIALFVLRLGVLPVIGSAALLGWLASAL